MSTTATKTKKQIGDRVVITGGPRKNIQGNIIALQGLKATLRTDDGERVADFDEARSVLQGAGATPRNVVVISAEKRWGFETLMRRIEAGLDGDLDLGQQRSADLLQPSSRTV